MSEIGAGIAALVLELLDDRARDGDQAVDPRRQQAQDPAVLLGADPARVDGRHDVRAGPADLAQGDRRARPDQLGPVHVVVDDLRPELGQERRHGPRGDGVVGLVDDRDRDPVPLELADAAALRQGHDVDVVAVRVDPGEQPQDVLLGAAVGARGEDLDDADAAARDDRSRDRLKARIARRRGAHRTVLRRTSRRWIGSSTAPHSYL